MSSLTPEDTFESIGKAGFVVEKHETENFMPKGEDAGLCKQEDVGEERHLFVYCKKPVSVGDGALLAEHGFVLISAMLRSTVAWRSGLF